MDLPDGPIELTPEEVEVRLSAREDFAAASGGGQVVVVDTRIDDDLRREGFAREVINRIQRVRKSMDLPYEARIEVSWQADGEVARAIDEHRERIAGETLATRLVSGAGDGDTVEETEIDGVPVRLAVTANR